MIVKARLLKRHLENILTYLQHRITNATAEDFNSKIQWIRLHAAGLPQPRELQDGDLLPLRGPRPVPTLNPEERLRLPHVYPEPRNNVPPLEFAGSSE
jgi:hypothetical protein